MRVAPRMRSSGERTDVYIYISIVTARPSSPQEGASLTLAPIICSKRQPGHHYTYRASTHVQQLSDNQQRRLEAETTHEREERPQQLSAAQVRS